MCKNIPRLVPGYHFSNIVALISNFLILVYSLVTLLHVIKHSQNHAVKSLRAYSIQHDISVSVLGHGLITSDSCSYIMHLRLIFKMVDLWCRLDKTHLHWQTCVWGPVQGNWCSFQRPREAKDGVWYGFLSLYLCLSLCLSFMTQIWRQSTAANCKKGCRRSMTLSCMQFYVDGTEHEVF
jgi:hypothetical protein